MEDDEGNWVAMEAVSYTHLDVYKRQVTHHAQDIKDNFDALEGSEVRVAGRLMSKRGMGKVSFCDLQDKSGRCV